MSEDRGRRLVIDLDDIRDKSILCPGDVILTQSYNLHNNNNNLNYITILVNFSLCDENPIVAKSINELFSVLPSDYQKFRNTFYMKVFRPANSIIQQIKCILNEYDITELVLAGGSCHLFLTLNAAEGEGNKWWYKSSWLLNPIIKQYFQDYIPIQWINKNSAVKLELINYLREKILLFKEISKELVFTLLSMRRRQIDYNYANNTRPVIAIINLPLQYEHLNSLFSQIKNIEPVFISPNRSSKHNKKNIIRSNHVGLITLISILFRKTKLQRIRNKQVYFSLLDKKISISTASIRQAVIVNNFKFITRIGELTKMFEKMKIPKSSSLVTDMTFGEDIILSNEISKLFGIRHINFQYVAMSKMLFPQIDLADEYYLYAKGTYEVYKKYSHTYKYYLPIKLKPEDYSKKNSPTLKMVIFTQPDKYTDRYLFFIRQFFERIRSEKLSIEVIIKPHYRQDKMECFEKIVSKFQFSGLASKSENCENLIINSDFSASMTSSVLFEALTLGKMAAIINLDGQDENFIYNNDLCFPEINFVIKSIEELVSLIKDYPIFQKDYKTRYNSYMAAQNAKIDYTRIFSNEEVL